MRPEERENLIYSTGKLNHVELEEKVMFSLLPKRKNLRILDVGCGVGNISKKLESIGDHKVVGIDFSKVAIKEAKKRIEAKVVDVDGEGLPFPNESFDVVYMGDIIEHVFDPINLFKESNRVLKKGGCLLLTTPNEFNMVARTRIFLTGKAPQGSVYRNLGISKHHTYFSWDLLQFMFRKTRFKLDQYRVVVPIPGFKRVTKSRFISFFLGKEFIIRLRK